MAVPVEAVAVAVTPAQVKLTMSKSWAKWWLRREALVPFILLLGILAVLLWLVAVLWSHVAVGRMLYPPCRGGGLETACFRSYHRNCTSHLRPAPPQ
jgi:hypothetical protein